MTESLFQSLKSPTVMLPPTRTSEIYVQKKKEVPCILTGY